jgi:hypothetical protein
MSPVLTLTVVLAFLALLIAIASAAFKDKVPLWVAVVLVCIVEILRVWPK